MSHTFKHDPTGVRIFYNSDFSGDATIVRPDGSEFQVPAAALAEFGSDAEAELARLRPVVEAAEALVGHWDTAEQPSADYIVRNGKLLYALAAKVKEAKRDGSSDDPL